MHLVDSEKETEITTLVSISKYSHVGLSEINPIHNYTQKKKKLKKKDKKRLTLLKS